jgi:TPR repeat protein
MEKLVRLGVIGALAGIAILATGGGAFWYRQQKLSDGFAAYGRSDFATAFRDLSPYNGWGNADAQYDLAAMYVTGKGTPKNDVTGFNIVSKLAPGGSVKAALLLAQLYDYGQGTDTDPKQAAYWYQVAANGGDLTSQVRLGQLYEAGTGVQQDYGQAASLYKGAADKGYAQAETALGKLYIAGDGVPQDYQAALTLLKKAASANDTDAEAQLGVIYANGEANSLSFDQAFSYLKSAAQAGNSDAQFVLGGYLTGDNGQDGFQHVLDVTQAYALFDLAAAQGDKDSVAAMKQLKDNLMGNIISDAQAAASKWHVGSPLPKTSLDDFAAQTMSLNSDVDKGTIPNLKIWFSVKWAEDGKQNEAVFIKQVGTDSGANNDPGTCHACSANISVVTFQNTGSYQDPQADTYLEPPPLQVNFTTAGSYGDVQPTENDAIPYGDPNRAGQKRFPFGQGKYLVLVPSSSSGQGQTNDAYQALLWIEDPKNFGEGAWIDAGYISTHEDDSGDCGPGEPESEPCYQWDGDISISQEGGEPVIKVATKGQMPTSDYKSLIPAPSAVYHFDGKKFVSSTQMN